MDGVKCSFESCSTHDFLPFYCQRCDGMYCLEHRSRFVHNCRDCDTFNEAPKRDLSHLPSVKTMLAAVENRFETEVNKGREHWGQVIRNSSDSRTSTVASNPNSAFARSMERLRLLQTDSSKSQEVQQRAEHTQQLLIKRRAMGKLSIPEADRVYLVVHFVPPHPSLNPSSTDLFPETDMDPLCLQYVFFPRTMTLGEAMQHLKEIHFNMLRSCFHLSGAFTQQDRVSFALYTLDSPDWRIWDRDIQLGHLCRSFEETWVTIVMIEDVLQAQRALTTPPPISELQHHHYHHASGVHHTAPPVSGMPSATSSASTATGAVPAPSSASKPGPASASASASTNVPAIAKGDFVWYHRGSNGIPLNSRQDAEAHNIPIILTKIVGVHHDDFPNIYYTITPVNPPTMHSHGHSIEDTEKLIFHTEKQTDSNRVFPAPEFKPANGTAANKGNAAPGAQTQNIERQRNELLQQKQNLLQLLSSKASSSGLWGTDAFTVAFSYGGSEDTGVTIAPRTTIGELREYARCLVALSKLGTMNPAMARTMDVKLIAKGVQLKQDQQLVRDTKIGPGTKIMVLG